MAADFGEFWRSVEWIGLQRHLKVLGIFSRLKHRDGKPALQRRTCRASSPTRTRSRRATRPCVRSRRLLEPLMGATTIEAFH